APIVTLAAGLLARSALVATLNSVLVNVWADGLVMPLTRKVTAAPAATAQVPPLSARVTVTVDPRVEAVAEQFVVPVRLLMTGVAGTVKAPGNAAVIVLPAASAPLEPPLTPGPL